MTDAEIRDAAVAELRLTTVGYINKNWKTPPAGTHWKAALDLLAQIDTAPSPPPPPSGPVVLTGGPDANARHLASGLSIGTDGQREDNFYCVGLVNINAKNVEISHFDAGPSNDSCIVVEDPIGNRDTSGFHIHDGKLHGSGSPRVHTWGDHGIYESGVSDKAIERVESYGHQYGQAFSVRWPNIHYRCWAHDTPYAVGIFDYTDGRYNNVWTPAVFRECLFTKISGWLFYNDTVRSSHTQGVVGSCTFGADFDHCTFDCAGQNGGTFNFAGDPADNVSAITNSILINPPTDWLRSARKVLQAGNVILSGSDVGKYLNPDFTPKQVVGSPIVGKAVHTSTRANALYGDLPDVGLYQAS